MVRLTVGAATAAVALSSVLAGIVAAHAVVPDTTVRWPSMRAPIERSKGDLLRDPLNRSMGDLLRGPLDQAMGDLIRDPLNPSTRRATRKPMHPAADLVYFDDFSDPSSGWVISPLANSSSYYRDGQYHEELSLGDRWAFGSLVGYKWADFDVRVKLRKLDALPGKTTWFTLMFRYVSGPSTNFYCFDASPDGGWYRVTKNINNIWLPVEPPTKTKLLKPAPEWNELRVVAHGDEFELYINGTFLVSTFDDSLSEGTLGLGAGSTAIDQLMHSAIDDVAVYLYPLDGTPQPTPTGRPLPSEVPTAPPTETAAPSPTATPTPLPKLYLPSCLARS